EGVFEKFPALKVVLYEGGIFWLPHVLWRFDKNWKAQRSETPWVREPPSAHILRHFSHATYPLEAPRDPAHLRQVLAMIEGEGTLVSPSTSPNGELGAPFAMAQAVPAELRRRVMVDNALAVYGERLLAPSRTVN